MWIRIVRATVCRGQPVAAGAVLDVDDREGEFLVQIGKAETAPVENPGQRLRRQRAVVEAPERAVLE